MSDQYQGYDPNQQQYYQPDPYQQQQQQYQQQYPPQQQQPAHQAAQPQQGGFYAQQAAAQAQGHGVRSVDSLSANEFAVEVSGERATGIFAVTGLSSYALRMESGKPVGMDFPPITVTKMVQQDAANPFNKWTRETVAARGTRLPTRDVSVVALDEGVETRRWVYRNCWISSIQFSDFDTALDFLIEEKITIQHGGVEEIWPQR